LDAGITGKEQMKLFNKSALSGIVISSIMWFVLFFAVFGVVAKGIVLDNDNPLATVFKFAAGEFGHRIFGVILWSAAISSVVGASYTSVSFFKTFHPVFIKYERWCIYHFIYTYFCFNWPVKTITTFCRRSKWFYSSICVSDSFNSCTKKIYYEGISTSIMDAVVRMVCCAANGRHGRNGTYR
jgi:predicted secreted protein